MVRSATRMLPGTSRTSSGCATPYSIAADIVTILLTEPGSYGEVTAALPSWLAADAPGLLGSNVVPVARARTLPVATSSTTAELLSLAPVFATKAESSRCTVYCRSESRVSCSVEPGTAGRS